MSKAIERDRLGFPVPKYLSDTLYITPAQILDALSRAERYAPTKKEKDELKRQGDGVGAGGTTTRQNDINRPTRLHHGVMQRLDRRRCQQVRVIEDWRSHSVPGWTRVRVFYVLKDGKAEIDQEIPNETLAALSPVDISEQVAARYDRVWNMGDEKTQLKMILPMVPRLRKNGQPDPSRKTIASEGYALWPTFPRLQLVRMIHPVERLHDPHRPEYNRVPEWGYIEAWDTAPKNRGMNLKVHIESTTTPLSYVGADGIYLAGWRVSQRGA